MRLRMPKDPKFDVVCSTCTHWKNGRFTVVGDSVKLCRATDKEVHFSQKMCPKYEQSSVFFCRTWGMRVSIKACIHRQTKEEELECYSCLIGLANKRYTKAKAKQEQE